MPIIPLFRIIAFSIFFAVLSIFILGCESRYEDLDLSVYQYRDTKDLVKFVYDASLILKKNGLKGSQYFRDNRHLYVTPNHYLYIYDMKGVNIYHAGMPHLEGGLSSILIELAKNDNTTMIDRRHETERRNR